MGLNFRKVVSGIAADLNVRDGGRSHGNMQATPRAPRPVAGPGIKFPSPGEHVRRVLPGPYSDIDRPQINAPIRPEVPQTPQVKQAIDKSKSMFQWTPEFTDIVAKANPEVTSNLSSGGLVRAQAAGTFGYKPGTIKPVIPGVMDTGFTGQQQLSVSPKYTDPFTLTHEGLHAAFQDSQLGPDFGPAYNASTKSDPNMAKYLRNRTRSYVSNQPGQKQDFNDFRKLNSSMQTEIHSYLSEYPTYSGKQLSPALRKYYSRFINPDVQGTAGAMLTINDVINKRKPRTTRYEDE